MEGNYTVYILEVPDGKKYVGCTKQPLPNRWQIGTRVKIPRKAFIKAMEGE